MHGARVKQGKMNYGKRDSKLHWCVSAGTMRCVVDLQSVVSPNCRAKADVSYRILCIHAKTWLWIKYHAKVCVNVCVCVCVRACVTVRPSWALIQVRAWLFMHPVTTYNVQYESDTMQTSHTIPARPKLV